MIHRSYFRYKKKHIIYIITCKDPSSSNCRHNAKCSSCVSQKQFKGWGSDSLIITTSFLAGIILTVVSIVEPTGQQWRVSTISNLVFEEFEDVGKLCMPPTIGYLSNSDIGDELKIKSAISNKHKRIFIQ